MKLRALSLLCLVLVAAACQRGPSQAEAMAAKEAELKQAQLAMQMKVDSLAAIAADYEDLEPLDWAPLKSRADRDALEKQWADAAELESKFLQDPKIDQWIASHPYSDTTDTRAPMALAELKSLTAKQCLNYALQNPEEYSQICSPGIGGLSQVLSRKLPYEEHGELRSDRQTDALQAKHKELEALVAAMLRQNKCVSKGMLFHIADLELHACILPLIDIYQQQTVKDDLILTTLSELMERGEGFEWLKSDVFKTMLLDPHYTAPLTAENAQAVIDHAQRFVVNAKEDQWK